MPNSRTQPNNELKSNTCINYNMRPVKEVFDTDDRILF